MSVEINADMGINSSKIDNIPYLKRSIKYIFSIKKGNKIERSCNACIDKSKFLKQSQIESSNKIIVLII